VARWFSIKPALTLRGRKFKGIRGFAGKPFHPPLTDFPITAYVLGGIFNLYSWWVYDSNPEISHNMFVAAAYVFTAGFIVSLPTILTGFWDWLKSTPKHTQARRTANWHMAVMLTTTVLVLITLVAIYGYWDEGHADFKIMALSLVDALLVGFGALYGGALVYEYGFNIETAGDSPVWHESEEDIFPGQEKAPPS
jgi:uncharacterized membrane protein